MTAPARYLTDQEICKELGIDEKKWRAIVRVLESEGLPQQDHLVEKRYWPKVQEFFDRRNGLGNYGASKPDGKEKLDAL